MGEKLNRNLQREILNRLSDDYPEKTDISEAFNIQDSAISVNVHYLEEHDLLHADWYYDDDDGHKRPSEAKISAAGLDFLADDGGLGAILNVLTVKLHDGTLKALLISKVEQSDGDETIKAKLISRIKDWPAEALGEAAKRLLVRGLDHLPSAIDALQKLLPS